MGRQPGYYLLQLIPEDGLAYLPFGGAVNILRKFIREIVKVTILHGMRSGMLR